MAPIVKVPTRRLKQLIHNKPRPDETPMQTFEKFTSLYNYLLKLAERLEYELFTSNQSR